MKKWICSIALGLMVGTQGAAQPRVRISIPLPPPIIFHAPPSVVILPQTQVYVVPDIAEEIFFSNGWWWRPWQGRWYRSHYYDRGWAHYGSAPSWYRGIPPRWRDDYRDHRWGNGAWNHRPIPHDDLHRNWKVWHDTRHWDQPQHRQHETRRDGRPFASHEAPGRRAERPDLGPRVHEAPRPVERGHQDRGGREQGRPSHEAPQGRPSRESSQPRPMAPQGRPDRGAGRPEGGHDKSPEPKRDRH